MDWAQILRELKARGWTQQLLAARVGASQSSISDLSSGKTANPTYSLGTAIQQLYASNELPTPTSQAA